MSVFVPCDLSATGSQGRHKIVQARTVRHTAALVIAKVAAIELPAMQWPDLIRRLLANMDVSDSGLRQSTLEALGYICEEMGKLDTDVLDQDEINSILTAVVKVIMLACCNSFNLFIEAVWLLRSHTL